MAKRKHYGSTKAAHRTGAGGMLQGARYRARQVRYALQSGDCYSAFDKLGILNRLIGKAQKELAHARSVRAGSMRGGRDILSRTAKSLQKKWLMKCMK